MPPIYNPTSLRQTNHLHDVQTDLAPPHIPFERTPTIVRKGRSQSHAVRRGRSERLYPLQMPPLSPPPPHNQHPEQVSPRHPPLTGPSPSPQTGSQPLIILTGKLGNHTGRGRTFIAARKIARGDVILIESPIVIYPTTLLAIKFLCSHCFNSLPPNPLFCQLCRIAKFCSIECFNLGHPSLLCYASHSLFIMPDCAPELLYLLAIYSLQPHSLLLLLSLPSNPAFQLDSELGGSLHSKLCALIPPNVIPTFFSPTITLRLLSKKKIHSFPIIQNPTHPTYENPGFYWNFACALFLNTSLLNHDCSPNICIFNDVGPKKIFRALREIDKGSEILISYVPMNMGYKKRQMMLMKDYQIRCKCTRCMFESQWKENQDEEQGTRVGGEEQGVSEADDGWCPYSEFFWNHVCDCNGFLAPFPPCSLGRENYLQCNTCGRVVERVRPNKATRH